MHKQQRTFQISINGVASKQNILKNIFQPQPALSPCQPWGWVPFPLEAPVALGRLCVCECQPPLPSFAHLNHTPHQPLPNLTSTSTIPQPFPQALLNLTTSSNTTYLNLNSLQPQPTSTTPKSYLHLNHSPSTSQSYLLFKHTLSEPQLSRNHASYTITPSKTTPCTFLQY